MAKKEGSDIEKVLKYKQPHNIHFDTGNPALDEHLVNKEHRRQRYLSILDRKKYEQK